MKHSKSHSLKSRTAKFSAVVIAVLIIAAGTMWRIERQKSPLWITLRPGKGGVFSVATGFDASGKEIVLSGGCMVDESGSISSLVTCQEIKDGKLRWEVLRPALDERLSSGANVAIGSNGGLFVGWGSAASDAKAGSEICRLSEKDGSTLWTWSPASSAELATDSSGLIHHSVPHVAKNGTVWTAWQLQSDQRKRVRLANLDGKSGRAIWTVIHNIHNTDETTHTAIHPLQNGNALLIHTLEHYSQTRRDQLISKHERLVQLISKHDGSVIWQKDIGFPIDGSGNHRARFHPGFHVDEERNRLIVIFGTAGRDMLIHFNALELRTGKELWITSLPEPAPYYSEPAPLNVRISKNGDVEYWISCSRTKRMTNWDDWGKRHGIPWPRSSSKVEEGLERLTLSGKTGTLIAKKQIFSGITQHHIKLENPGNSSSEIYMARSSKKLPSSGPFIGSKTSWIQLDARRWFDNPKPSGRAIAYRAVKSPSGMQILSRSTWKQYSYFTDHLWEIQAW